MKEIISLGEKHGWSLKLKQSRSSLVQLEKKDMVLNVYKTKDGRYTVGTVINHPFRGRNQLFRKKIALNEVEAIMKRPRKHTGKGYRKKRRW